MIDGRNTGQKRSIANGLNVREAAVRLKIGKTALYAALQELVPPTPDDSGQSASGNKFSPG